jgi:hypothetical protein
MTGHSTWLWLEIRYTLPLLLMTRFTASTHRQGTSDGRSSLRGLSVLLRRFSLERFTLAPTMDLSIASTRLTVRLRGNTKPLEMIVESREMAE